MKIGYARVSTEQQVLARQLDQLQAYGCDIIYQEKMTGTKKDRPEYCQRCAFKQELATWLSLKAYPVLVEVQKTCWNSWDYSRVPA